MHLGNQLERDARWLRAFVRQCVLRLGVSGWRGVRMWDVARTLGTLELVIGLSGLGMGMGLGAQAAGKAEHWAFKPVERSLVPLTRSPGWIRSPVDAFILARLDREGLRPSREADKVTLLRRLSLDLIGLPPTIEEVERFMSDKAPGAYEREVERLLASKHYGERWGRHWLDAARYADSNGYEKDRAREMWHYRDWVVEAMNADMPYDRFVIEQFAGDLVEPPTQASMIATGFLRNSMINEEGAIDPEQFRMDAMFDRMDAMGKSVLGLTISCAQCHTHKYDPLTQEEYYRMFAFLNDVDEYTAPVYSVEELDRRESVLREIAEVEESIRREHPDWRERMRVWEMGLGDESGMWTVVEPYEYGAPDGLSKLQLQSDGSLLAGGHRYQGGTWFVKARTTMTNITGVRVEFFTNGNLPMRGPGRSSSGMFGLQEFTWQAGPVGVATNLVKVGWGRATADFEPVPSPEGDPTKEKDKDFVGGIGWVVDGNPRTGWTVDAGPGRRNVDRKAVFQVTTNIGHAGGTEMRFELACREEVGCFRLSLTTAARPVADPLPRAVRAVLSIPAERRTAEQTALVFGYWRTIVPAMASQNERIEALWKRYPERSGETLAMAARPVSRSTTVLKRGDWLQPGRRVEPGVPSILNPLSQSAEPSRLRFARWLVDRKAPTTARVIVNRVWQSYFGVGLVSTPEDFGLQGEAPSHPELLDWLAVELMEPSEAVRGEGERGTVRPWSLKHLHRLIVTSATYRQSSRVDPAVYAKDQFNRLLARAPRVRVEGEIVRDISLATSGLLNPKMGGPSVYSPAPAFLFVPPTSYMAFPWKDATDADRYRRAIYTFRRRSTPYPMLQTFDTPNGDASCIRRVRSNTPLQALTALNETLFVECAQALARKILEEGGKTDSDRVSYGFRRVVSRWPSDRERRELMGLVKRQRAHLGEGWVSAAELSTGQGEVPKAIPSGSTPVDWGVYTVVSRVLLNLDEAITKE